MPGAVNLKTSNGHTLVDEELLPELSQFCWQIRVNKVSGKRYVGASMKNAAGEWKTVYLHRYIMGLPESDVVDHINGDELDNRRENLRHTNQSVNRLNSRKSKSGGTSKYKGVHKRDRKSPWTASIKLPEGKYKNIGSFKTEIEAARAYDAFAKATYGTDVLINGV